jgi:hypothetical protein
MRLSALVAFVAVVRIGSTSVAAQQPDLPLANPSFESLFAPKSKAASPPRYLFPTPTPRVAQSRDGRSGAEPTVLCGLTLIPGDSNVDRGIRQDIPADGPRYSIRPVDPKLCRRP